MRVLFTRPTGISASGSGASIGPRSIREVLDEVAAIADRENIDLVLHSGDVFDRPVPAVEALTLGLQGLVALTDGGRRPVVAIAGNHDSPGFFEALAPFVSDRNVHLVGEIKAPEAGGVLDIETPAGRAIVSCFPFLREGRAFNVWEPPEEHYKKYADRLRQDRRGLFDPCFDSGRSRCRHVPGLPFPGWRVQGARTRCPARRA